MAQRDGNSNERPMTGGSRREPPIIDGQAREVASGPAEDVTHSAEAQSDEENPTENGGAIAAPPARRRTGALLFLIVTVLAIAAAIAALLLAPGVQLPDSVRSRIAAQVPQNIAAQLPDNVQKLLGLEQNAPQPSAASTTAGDRQAAAAAPESKSDAASQSAKSEPAPPKEEAPPAPVEPARRTETVEAPTSAAPVQTGAPAMAEDKSRQADAQKFDELSARIDALQSKVETRPAPSSDQREKIDALAARLAALEASLAQPKSQARASESRENVGEARGDALAARVVVAQSLVQQLAAGAPLGDSVAALHNLGAPDDALSSFAPFARSGAPTSAQLATQWRALRAKIVAADAPAPQGDWSDQLLAKAKSLVKIEAVGVQQGSSAAAVFSRVDAALGRGDIQGAVKESDTLGANARQVASDWRSAAEQRLKADAAARALLTDSIAALARPKS